MEMLLQMLTLVLGFEWQVASSQSSQAMQNFPLGILEPGEMAEKQRESGTQRNTKRHIHHWGSIVFALQFEYLLVLISVHGAVV